MTQEADPTSQRRTCTIPEAGKVLGLSRESAYKAAKTGEIYTLQIGRRKLVPLVWLERKLEGQGA
jgi:hypothetical protein